MNWANPELSGAVCSRQWPESTSERARSAATEKPISDVRCALSEKRAFALSIKDSHLLSRGKCYAVALVSVGNAASRLAFLSSVSGIGLYQPVKNLIVGTAPGPVPIYKKVAAGDVKFACAHCAELRFLV